MEDRPASTRLDDLRERKPNGSHSTVNPNPKAPTLPRPPSTRIPIVPLQLIFPITLILGFLVSALSPLGSQPSYFRLKRNIFNVFFVKYGWFWTTAAAVAHISRIKPSQQLKAVARYALATLHWILVTQWFFGPPLMDRAFVLTGGVCEIATAKGEADSGMSEVAAKVVASAACRMAKGKWTGGHDLSGHVFLLTHASLYLASELWPVLSRQGYRGWQTKSVLAVLGLWWWMLLMTSLYFHTGVEKITGMAVAYAEWYLVYVLVDSNSVTRPWLGLA